MEVIQATLTKVRIDNFGVITIIMAKIFFNNKQSGDDLTASNVNDLKSGINTMHDDFIADISSLHNQDSAGGSSSTAEAISNNTVSGYYDSNNQLRYNHHIIPESNANFDLGSAEYKIRHLYLSSNSLWVGDQSKIDASSGEIKTRKRNKSKLPHYITGVLNGTEQGALDFTTKDSIENLTLFEIEKYAQSLNTDVSIIDIFPPETSDNYFASDYVEDFTLKASTKQDMVAAENANDINYPNAWNLDISKSSEFDIEIKDPSTSLIFYIKKSENNNFRFNINLNIRNPNILNGDPFIQVIFNDVNSGQIFYREYNRGDINRSSSELLNLNLNAISEVSGGATIVFNAGSVNEATQDGYNNNGDKFYIVNASDSFDGSPPYTISGSSDNWYIYTYLNNGKVFFDCQNATNGDQSFQTFANDITIHNTDSNGYVTEFSSTSIKKIVYAKYDYQDSTTWVERN